MDVAVGVEPELQRQTDFQFDPQDVRLSKELIPIARDLTLLELGSKKQSSNAQELEVVLRHILVFSYIHVDIVSRESKGLSGEEALGAG